MWTSSAYATDWKKWQSRSPRKHAPRQYKANADDEFRPELGRTRRSVILIVSDAHISDKGGGNRNAYKEYKRRWLPGYHQVNFDSCNERSWLCTFHYVIQNTTK